MGTSRVLAVGPVAVDSLMVATAIAPLAAPNTPQCITLAITLAVMVGSIEPLMGLFRLGFLVNFLSRSIISGFISGAALIIVLSQVKHLLGVRIPWRAKSLSGEFLSRFKYGVSVHYYRTINCSHGDAFHLIILFLPQTCLATVIITAVYKLIDLTTLKRMWAYDKIDAIAWLVTFTGVLALGV